MAGFLSVVYGSLFLFLLSVLKLWLLSRWLLPRLISFVVRRVTPIVSNQTNSSFSPTVGAPKPASPLPVNPDSRIPHGPIHHPGASIEREGRGHHRRRRRILPHQRPPRRVLRRPHRTRRRRGSPVHRAPAHAARVALLVRGQKGAWGATTRPHRRRDR